MLRAIFLAGRELKLAASGKKFTRKSMPREKLYSDVFSHYLRGNGLIVKRLSPIIPVKKMVRDLKNGGKRETTVLMADCPRCSSRVKLGEVGRRRGTGAQFRRHWVESCKGLIMNIGFHARHTLPFFVTKLKRKMEQSKERAANSELEANAFDVIEDTFEADQFMSYLARLIIADKLNLSEVEKQSSLKFIEDYQSRLDALDD